MCLFCCFPFKMPSAFFLCIGDVINIRQLPRPILAQKGQSQHGKGNLSTISAWPASLKLHSSEAALPQNLPTAHRTYSFISWILNIQYDVELSLIEL